MTEKSVSAGSVQIHEKVLFDIISTAIRDIKGVHLDRHPLISGLSKLFGQRQALGVQLKLGKDKDLIANIYVRVQFGLHIPDIAREIQDVLKRALEKSVDINIKDINVHVRGIERGRA